MTNLAKSVKWNITVAVEGAPTMSSAEETQTDAVDVVSISLKKNSALTAEIQPGVLDEVKFIYIALQEKDLYGKVKYNYYDGTNDSAEVILDKAHFLTSGELIKLFKFSPNKIKFTNLDQINDVDLVVVVARKATP